ncbi:MAG: hypothetical protein JST42_00165 [Bacteroidetes bacterium]|nr:hypothetical protein [Bacteroidota bacterium]
MKRIVVFFVLLSLRGSCQVPAELGKAMDQYRAQRLQEKIYVHTDKEFYLAGEICWFKLYVVEATSHRPLDLSKIAYLEWLDGNNKPVLQEKIGLDKGHGDGSVYLPLTMRSGNYKLRAYTAWMKNYGEDWYFEKAISVANVRRSAEASIVAAAPKYGVSFFPEGGNLVEDIESRIGFSLTDGYGKGVFGDGVIIEDDRDTVARCTVHRMGIGSFVLRPRPGHHYAGAFRVAGGQTISADLPTAYKAGAVMRVSPEGADNLRVDLQSTTARSDVYLVAHTRGRVTVAEAGVLRDGKASFEISGGRLGEGISQITVFDAQRRPLCERLVFRLPSDTLKLVVKPDGTTYGTRKKIDLAVAAADGVGKPVVSDCSLSVFRVDGLQSAPVNHIGSYLLLSSDLKGRIDSPGYYLEHPEDAAALDNLMLTHGWRRYRWEQVLRGDKPSFEFAPEYNGVIISGRVVDGHTGARVNKEVVAYLSVPGTRTQFCPWYSDSLGTVRFELKDFYDAHEVVLQLQNEEDSLYRVDVVSPWSDRYSDRRLTPLELASGDSSLLVDKGIAMQVLNRYGGVRLKRFRLPSFIDSSTFYGVPDFSYLLDDYTRFTTMEEVMREYVRLMMVKKRSGHFHLPLLDLQHTEFFDEDPLILLDGVPVKNIDSLMVLDPLKIRKLETVQRRFFLGGTDFKGIMNWITYKGDLGGYILDPHSTVLDYEGLELQREFYSPSYASEGEAGSHLADFRNVLYWAPQLVTDEQGRGGVSCYSSDIPGRYVVVVEGLTADGKMGSGVAEFEVK